MYFSTRSKSNDLVGHVLLVIVVVSLLTSNASQGARILMVPMNMNSHIIYFTRLGEGLSRLGHVVHLVAPHNARIAPPSEKDVNFTMSTYKVPGDIPFAIRMSQSVLEIALLESKVTQVRLTSERIIRFARDIQSDCQHLLEDKPVMDEIHKHNFDFAIMDSAGAECYSVVPYALGLPYALMSVSWISWQYRVPRLPSFSPFFYHADVLTFKERLFTLALEVTLSYAMENNDRTIVEKYAPGKPVITLSELHTRNSLWFYLEDIALGYARPHMPNTLPVGDIIVGQPVQDLPDRLQEFISNTPDGGSVIVVSFGSFIDFIPRNIAEKFCDGFRQSKTHRIIWKLKFPEYCTPDYAPNVLILPWMPQNDLLAHERVHLFISHGGYNSLTETVYHAKPVIVVPISMDQPANARLILDKGIGISINIRSFTAEELFAKIELMLAVNNTYKDAANRASAILRDKPDGGAAQRVSNMIKHVLKHGDAHLRTGAFQLNTFQYFMFDIFAFLTSLVVLSAVFIGLCFYFTCKLMLRKFCQKSALSVWKHKTN